jgi:hypothetical protein
VSRRAPSLGPVDLALLASLAFVVPLVLLGSSSLRPHNTPELDPRAALLPLYLLFSLARLVAAYGTAVVLALATGYLAARSTAARA